MKVWHVNDVMTTDVIAVGPDVAYRELVALLAANRINAVPVVDRDRRVLGVVSESDLLRKIEYVGAGQPRWFERNDRTARRKADALTAGELMTAPAVVVLPTTGIRTAARRMNEAHVKQMPVEDPLGRLVGIVSRSDLLKEHLRPDDEIATDVRAAVHEATYTENLAAVEVEVRQGVVDLTGRVERWSTAMLAVRLVRLVPGVVDVLDEIAFDVDDHRVTDPVPAHAAG
ncbi:CBS domain-containing protein [Actinoplanes teichomyceticus]|uniref:CBS domain protein n=1 Tax=Actinoplanes teichomyceticus TaxID=1867 RepID=A0A561VIT5_ACTTI|nr:CBS domain-containing protein [Actinoplanes teichomyceticus]TWG11528.1 CBS domain protein [Actinoplanes teichomyceticus]